MNREERMRKALGLAVPPPSTPVDRHIVATTWEGPKLYCRLHQGEESPAQEDLDALPWVLGGSGVKPKLRVIEMAFHRPEPVA